MTHCRVSLFRSQFVVWYSLGSCEYNLSINDYYFASVVVRLRAWAFGVGREEVSEGLPLSL